MNCMKKGVAGQGLKQQNPWDKKYKLVRIQNANCPAI
jgi:hypothetical protein